MTRWNRLLVWVAVVVLASACSHELDGPAPSVSGVAPNIICTEQLDTVVTLTGDGLSPLAIDALTDDPQLALPAITLTLVKDLAGQPASGTPITLPDDPADPTSSSVTWASQTSMTFTISPQLALAPGVYDITVANANGKSFTASELLGAIPPPVLETIEPDLTCVAEGAQVLTLTGTGFLKDGAALPSVTIGGQVFVPDSVSGCLPLGGGVIPGAELCTTLAVTVPTDGLPEGAHDVTVTNPASADCTSVQAVTVAVVPPPVIDSFNPEPVCNDAQLSSIEIVGSGFLDVNGTLPTVNIDGSPYAVTATSGCTAVVGTLLNAQSCTSITIDVPADTLAGGDHDVVVQNPAPADCSNQATATLTAVETPTVTGIVPAVLCQGGGDIVIQGTGFAPSAQVSIGGVPLTINNVATNGTQIDATLGAGLAPGIYDVVVDNGDGCAVTVPNGFTVTPGPAVFFVDPSVVYNGISVQATIYISGLLAAPAQVTIRPSGQTTTTALVHTWNPAKPNRILATIPSGLAAGDWDVIVDDGSCSATLPTAFTVTDTLTVAIEAIEPPFGWTDADTAVTITAIDPPPANMVQFQATPRVYLNPDVPGPNTVASLLDAVVFVDATRLTAIVPQGLPAGVYDLIVVNPDGSVGLLDASFVVTATGAPPPTIETITPASVINQSGQAVEIIGENFRSPSVEATCEDDGGGTQFISGTVTGSTSTTVDVTFDMSSMSSGVCVIRVINSDGTYADYSAIAVTNPAQNLPDTALDSPMVVARRALGADAGRVTSQSRFLYAVGGDDGTNTPTRHASVEAAPVGLFGGLGTWSMLPAQSELPEARSFAQVVNLGRFLYLVGGLTDAGATDSVVRAQILDPQAAPDVTDLAFDFSDGVVGLDGGLYYYLVSAVMANSDPSNPGGETLASNPQPVRVPPVPQKILATLTWSAVPGAVSYRVYRTPAADMLLGSARLLTTVNTTSYTDTGTAVGTDAPQPSGSLGNWHEVGPLSVPREAAGITLAPDPTLPSVFHLYAIGGRDDTGAALGDYDLATITVAADGSQSITSFASGGGMLVTARWQLGAVSMDHDRASVIPAGEVWVFALAGLNSAGTGTVSDTTAARVGAGGVLEMVTETDTMTPARAGYAYAGANDFLYSFGGATSDGGSARGDAISAELCSVGNVMCMGGPPEPPDLINWNSLGFSLAESRYLPGSALESAFIFIVGGATDALPATTSTESTHW